jgi:hypothetical protein
MEGKRQQLSDPDARPRARFESDGTPVPAKDQDAAIDTEDRQSEREASEVENLKSRGNGDHDIEDGSLSGR